MTERLVVGMHEAKTQFSKLVKQAGAGTEIVVERYGRPVARIVGIEQAGGPRRPGLLAGKVTIHPGFDDIPEGLAEAFGACPTR
jgi:prevent-host-death family protein